MKNRKTQINSQMSAVIIIIALIAISVSLLSIVRLPHLVLRNDHSGAVVFIERLDEGSEFAISFIHSVNISPVKEIFMIRDGQIVLTALEFYTFGAGMPTELEQEQTLTQLPDGGMRIDGFDREFSNLSYIIGYNTNHTLSLESHEIPLETLDRAGQPLLFSFERLTILQRLLILKEL